MTNGLRIAPQVVQALSDRVPVVALESALITHGFPRPTNAQVTHRMMDAIREEGAIPAVIAVLHGEPTLGLTDAQLEALAQDPDTHKISLRDLPLAAATHASGGTTVAATSYLAHRAGISVFATGGIGGVHHGQAGDVSADLPVLASTPIVVVCSGAKAILDLPRTREYLETSGVPVVGYGTEELPAFYSRESGLAVDVRADSPAEVARIAQARSELDLPAALLVCVPVPEADQLPTGQATGGIAQAIAEAEAHGVQGKDLTPFLLSRLVSLTSGAALRANKALLVNNARVAAQIAVAMAATPADTGPRIG